MFGKKNKRATEIVEKKPKKKGRVFWGISGFLIILALAYMPSVSSILFLAVGILLLPVQVIRDAIQKILPKKAIRGSIYTVLAIVALLMAPVDETAQSVIDDVTPPAIEEQVEDNKTPIKSEQENTQEKQEQAPAVNVNTETSEPIDEANPEEEAVLIPEDSSFEVHYIDVGQADAALVLCDGEAMLIDGGNSGDSSLIYSYLKQRSVNHLDYIVATHGHEDHVGGLSGALNYATVDKAYCAVTSYDSDAFRDFVKYLEKQNKSITVPKVGESFALGSANVQIVGVDSTASDPNNTSIVLRVLYGDTSFLFTGDAEREAEQAILDSGYEIGSTVLKVGHHGSETSTSYVFLREVAPEYAVISVGKGNSYGHPTEDALSRLRDADVKVYRTDLQGSIVCSSDGKTVTFDVSKNENIDTLVAPKEEKPVVETPAVVVPPVVETPKGEEIPAIEEKEPEAEPDYIGNNNPSSMKFHYPSCSSVKKMKESNKFYFNGNREEMIAMGYSPCGNCHP